MADESAISSMWQIVGQQRAVDLLRNSLERGRLAHAYLFLGLPHVGKMTLALNLAQALNCQGEGPPCGECPSCMKIASGKHADVSVIGLGDDLRTEIGIDQIRGMQHSAHLKPYEGRYRVFILEGTEHLSHEAANCLLKTLEEPPANVVLLLLATSASHLLPTVVSRCQRVDLPPLSPGEVKRALVEQWQLSPERAELLARLSQGCLGWAVSALRDQGLLERRSLKLSQLIALADATLEERFSYASEWGRSRDSVRESLELWLSWWRDLLLVKGRCGQFMVNVDRAEIARQEAGSRRLSRIKGFIEALRAAFQQLEQNANPRLVLEFLMLSLPVKGESHA